MPSAPTPLSSDVYSQSTALASVDEVLATARSVRRRLDFDRPVARETIFDCINLATQAPTGLGGESWRFVVVTEPAAKERLAALYGQALEELVAMRGLEIKPSQRALVARLHEIPAMILVCNLGLPPALDVAGQLGYYGSILPAAWSLMLALRARGIGATWTSLLAARQSEVAAVIDLPEDALLTVMLPIAYTKNANLKRAKRLDARALTYWERWGQPSPE